MQIINTTNINEARKQIQKLKKEQKKENPEKIAVLSQDDEFNRKALEIKGLNMLIINVALEIKDYSKQRNSQLNEILAKICAQKGIEIGIQIDEIIRKGMKEQARALSRLMQNIMLCKKAGAKLFFIGSIKDKKALQSLLISLKASTKQAFDTVKQHF
jgi:RNase P/RNase MRP subunit p30